MEERKEEEERRETKNPGKHWKWQPNALTENTQSEPFREIGPTDGRMDGQLGACSGQRGGVHVDAKAVPECKHS